MQRNDDDQNHVNLRPVRAVKQGILDHVGAAVGIDPDLQHSDFPPQSMNRTQLASLLVFGVFAVIGFGPVSPGCLIGMYSVIARPQWILRVVRGLYQFQREPLYPMPPIEPGTSRRVRIKAFLSFLTLFLIDIAPYPVTPSIAIPVILIRPRWFYEWVERIYAD